MKRGLFIFILGFVVAAVGYGCIYQTCTSSARNIERSDVPELAWFQQEFNLNEGEFKQVSELHLAYLPKCREMCRQIDAQNARLQKLLSAATNETPQINEVLAESARLRSDCQRMMLHHFFAVAKTMPPDQGRRYLSWVQGKAFQPNYGMTEQP